MSVVEGVYNVWDLFDVEHLNRESARERANYYAQLAANRMVQRRRWPNDESPFKVFLKY